MDGIDLVFDDEAISIIVQKARALGTGARGLRSVMESTMLDVMFDIHSQSNIGHCRVTADTVAGSGKAIYEERKATA